jgi:hypothetical protein
MNKGRPATSPEKNYTLRRVVYNILLAARSIISLENKKLDFTEKEIVKFTAIMMARNFDEFLFGTNHSHDDDIHVSDFNLSGWEPKLEAKLDKEMKDRISKCAGHIVSSKPPPFKNDKETKNLVIPLIIESSEFVRQCIESGQAKYTGKAKKYVKESNALLRKLDIPLLPKS